MSLDDLYTIDTPENIEFRYDIAGIGSRFLAAIVDSFFLIIIQVILATVMFTLGSILNSNLDPLGGAADSLLLALWGLLSFVFLWGYYLFFELAWNGQSPGKRLINLRVVREGGRPITFVASATRNLIRLIDFLPTFYGLGLMTMFIDRRARRLGDLAGGTIVVKERGAVSLESLTRQPEQLPLPAAVLNSDAPLLPNLNLLSVEDYNLVQEFLRRRGELGPASRQRLGLQLADKLRMRLGMGPQTMTQEQFLERIAIDYRRMQEEVRL